MHNILLDVTYADPQAVGHMRAGSANRDGLATSKSEARKRSHYARPGQVSFDERSYKLATLAVESFWAPRKGRQRPDRPDTRKHRRRNGRIVPGEERRLQGTPFPNHLRDHSGNHLTPSASVPTCSEGPTGYQGKAGSKRSTPTNDMGVEH